MQCQTNKTRIDMFKFNVNGRELESYQLSNEEIVELIKDGDIDKEKKDFLLNKVLERFTYEVCRKDGETEDDVFARQFGNFVNGKMCSKTKVAERMSCEHRYLQNEMFNVCMAYITKLAENCEKGYFDPRNEYACKTSKKIIDCLKQNS